MKGRENPTPTLPTREGGKAPPDLPMEGRKSPSRPPHGGEEKPLPTSP